MLAYAIKINPLGAHRHPAPADGSCLWIEGSAGLEPLLCSPYVLAFQSEEAACRLVSVHGFDSCSAQSGSGRKSEGDFLYTMILAAVEIKA